MNAKTVFLVWYVCPADLSIRVSQVTDTFDLAEIIRVDLSKYGDISWIEEKQLLITPSNKKKKEKRKV